MKSMIIHFDVTAGKQAEFETAMQFHVNNVRKRDPSYSLYSLTRVKDSATRYVLMQQFESWETQLAHQSYDYVLAAMAAIDVCLAGPPSVELLDVIL